MRIACVHVPQFALQCRIRIDPSLRGAAVAVVGAGFDPAAGVRPSLALHSPIVLACSRAAWMLGIRLGMTASAARFVSPEVRVVVADAQLERETVRAIADTLLAVSAVVDTGGRVAGGGAHLAMYCEVPSKTRGTTFGDRLLALLETFGLAARIGIADDRFTAWVAAAHGADGGGTPPGAAEPNGGAGGAPEPARSVRPGAGVSAGNRQAGGVRQATGTPRQDRGVVSVPRGGSAAFLAPRPLSLLAITPEVQHMLESLGVRTLGEFAALPAPSVSRPLEADYQALARGDSGNTLRPYAPEAPIREELTAGNSESLFGGAAVVAALADRVALRLAGRARGAARLEVTILGGGGGERVVPVTATRAASTQPELIDLIAPPIGEGPIAKLRIVVVGEAVAGAASGAEARAAGAPIGEAGSRGVGSSPVGSIDAVSAALSSAAPSLGTAMPLRASLDHLAPLAPLDHAAPLAQVGRGQPWQLSTPQSLRSERRDAHRRTRRARQRRRTVTLAQSQLFGNLDG